LEIIHCSLFIYDAIMFLFKTQHFGNWFLSPSWAQSVELITVSGGTIAARREEHLSVGLLKGKVFMVFMLGWTYTSLRLICLCSVVLLPANDLEGTIDSKGPAGIHIEILEVLIAR
jgi:hypothetical protein